MEWSLFLPHYDRLSLLESWLLEENPCFKGIQELFGSTTIRRFYFGQEFCQRAIPTARELGVVFEKSKKHKKNFTLVTPYVSEKGLEKIQALLREFRTLQPKGEVVVNDWGVLYLVAAKFPTLKPVLGRLLNKIWRDPRMTSFLRDVPREHLQLFQTCSLAGNKMRDLLKQMKVKRIELDNLLQGLSSQLPNWGYQVSLYVPYGSITTGRICLFNSWGMDHQEKFKASDRPCSGLCRSHRLRLIDRDPNIEKDVEILQLGNTVFYRPPQDLIKRGLLQAVELGVDRIIVQPEPF